MLFPRQIKPRILKLTTRKGHSNLLTALSFANCEGKGYYRIVSVGHLICDCRSYCGRSNRMQGDSDNYMEAIIRITFPHLRVRMYYLSLTLFLWAELCSFLQFQQSLVNQSPLESYLSSPFHLHHATVATADHNKFLPWCLQHFGSFHNLTTYVF